MPYATRAPYSGNLPPEERPAPRGGCPSRAPCTLRASEVSKKRNVFPRSLLPPLGVAAASLGTSLSPPRPVPTAPCFQVPYKTSQARRKKRPLTASLHFHHGRHLPGFSPSGREARSPQRAGAGTTGNQFPCLSAQAPPGRTCARKASDGE